MELKNRNEMNPQFTWDLSPIFADVAAWEAAYAEASALVEEIPTLKGTLGNSKESLKAALDKIALTSEKVELCYVYTFLLKSGDNGSAEYQSLQARGISLYVKMQTALSFLDPELLSIPEETLSAWMASDELALYRFLVENVTRARPHTLSEKEETLLAMLGDAANIPSDNFDMLESVDMTFPKITDEKGEEVTLTHGNFGVYRESKDRRVRKDAFEAYFGEFKKYIHTFTSMYTGSVKFDTFFADARKHESACHAALFGGNVPVSVYDSLIAAVHDAFPAMKRYIELRKKVLDLDEIHMYDLYSPLVESVDYPMPYADAKELVKKALLPLGEEYQTLLDKAYNEKWIDVYENKGKTTGAYSCGVYGVHPYVLLNYTDTLDDAFTLAHELGHAMHSYFSAREQEYINADYRILVAEVASTVNEVLLTKYLLATETDPARRAYILNHFLEGFRTTLFRQTLFAEFERKAHDLHKAGTPLTAELLNEVYHDLNAAYYQGAVVDELQDIEWARIPHFYRAFYVYQYATGFSSAVAIAESILSTGDASNYLRFLSTGGSDYPLEELKIAGVDLTKPETVSNALKVFDSAIGELEELLLK
ncbi:MAG: oligoendopeptidase F [Clostridia bacterium]|nr:oligoendopeptidase F [Clostridia bacterium]